MGAEGPTGRVAEGASCSLWGAGRLACPQCRPFLALSLPAVCDPVCPSAPESEMPRGWGPPAKGLTHREWLTGFPSLGASCHNTLRG